MKCTCPISKARWVVLAGAVFGFCALLCAAPARAEYEQIMEAGRRYHVYRISSGQRLRLHLNDDVGRPLGTFERLKALYDGSSETLEFATNAGIYMEDLRPLGWYVERGRELRALLTREGGYGNFYMQPNGAFLFQGGRAVIRTTAELRSWTSRPDYATQSGPILVRNGKVNGTFRPNSEHQRVRSGVGVTREHESVFVLSDEPVTFFEIASVFGKRLGCLDALYLDGEISAMFVRGRDLPRPRVSFGPMFALVRKR